MSMLRAGRAAMRQLSSSAAPKSVGFIGLGNMGGPMAVNLAKAGHNVVCFDMSASALERVTEAGATAAKSVADVARQVDAMITMLPAAAHVRGVFEGPDGILANARDKCSFIDCSTIDPATVQDLAERARAERSASLVDAPVSGGVPGATNATLTFMVGASEDDFAKARELLAPMGKNIVHCGGTGMGQVAKICNNLVLGITMTAVSEGMSLGAALGMDPQKLASIFNSSTARCWSSDTYNPFPGVIEGAPASRGYTGGFGSSLMLKDLGLALEAAESVKTPLALGHLTHQLYTLHTVQGSGNKDFSSIIEMLMKRS